MAKNRNTKQKSILEECLGKFKGFFSGEDLFDEIRRVKNNIGIATIYRFLKEKRERGELHSYTCNRKVLYSRENLSHCHFTCESCGRIQHFSVSSLNDLKKLINGEICHIQIDVSGICNECKNRK